MVVRPRMERLGCSECTGIAIDQEIRTPGELRRVVTTLFGEITRGALEQEFFVPALGIDQPTIQALLDQPFPDVFRSAFRCRYCGQSFQLSCETYHGSGGRWSVQPPGADTSSMGVFPRQAD